MVRRTYFHPTNLAVSDIPAKNLEERFNGFIVDSMNNLSKSYKNKLETNENSLSSLKRGK